MQQQEYEKQLICRQDVKLLVTQMMKDEEATIKLIIERLLEAGSINWINQKVRFTPINRGLKKIAHCANPMGQVLGYRWLVKKTPRLITNWLFSKVSFKKAPPKVQETVTVTARPMPHALLESQQQEIKQLKARLRLTSGAACIMIASLGSLLIWQNADLLVGISQAQNTPTTPHQ